MAATATVRGAMSMERPEACVQHVLMCATRQACIVQSKRRCRRGYQRETAGSKNERNWRIGSYSGSKTQYIKPALAMLHVGVVKRQRAGKAADVELEAWLGLFASLSGTSNLLDMQTVSSTLKDHILVTSHIG